LQVRGFPRDETCVTVADMNFKAALEQGCYCLALKSDTKNEIIGEMVELLVKGGRIRPADGKEVLRAILEREQKISTGLQHGVAVPHGKTNAVEELVTAIALKKEGVDFESLDGEPSRIFVMTVSSPLRAGPHMEYLAEISRLLNSASVRKRVLEADSINALIGALTDSV